MENLLNMEKKINIAQLLKDCPQGMELDCVMFENLEFDYVDESSGTYPIVCRVKTEFGNYNIYTFTEYGCYRAEKYSKCVIFPKGKTTWEGFVPPCKFKVGDKVRHKNNHNVRFTITNIEDDSYVCGANLIFCFDDQDNYELVPNKFDINTLVPFESRVLVRNSDSGFWKPAFWGIYEVEKSNEHQYRNYLTTEGFVRHCIPYNDETKHLLGTSDNCDDFYKIW